MSTKNNAGHGNAGHWNTGHWNAGHGNAGHWNAGDWNIGNSNTGNSNTGNSNTGNRNTGHWNAGDWNIGDSNTGYWNSCNKETGFFNSVQSEKVRVFNKECLLNEWEECDKPSFIYFEIIKWVSSSDMTDQEREDNPTYITTDGYLKVYEYKEAFKKSWDEADEEDRKKIFNLPNFDAEVFKEISGIDVHEDSDKIKKIAELEEKAQYIADELKKLKQ